MSQATRDGAGNQLLASLPAEDEAYLQSISRIEQPPQGRTLSSRSEKTTELWFPHTGLIALTVTDVQGRSVQTGMVGSEGCIGLEAVFDRSPLLPDAVVQVEGPMSVFQAPQLRAALAARPSIQAALARFLYSLAAQSLQTIACNRLHSLLARCCRWLLAIHDCATSNDLPLTQETLATLLGSGRPRINGLLARLEKSGLLRRQRGQIRLLQRAELERQTCGCYRIVRPAARPLT